MGKRGAKGCLVAASVWLIILGVLAVAAKFFILPYFQKDLEEKTSSARRYRHTITLAADSFSGYCFFRSPLVENQLKAEGIKLIIRDDKADYKARMKALQSGSIQMAVFTIDSFITAGMELGEFPGTIIMVIDETKGADALVSYKTAVASLEDLNNPNARIVLTPRSPSEFLSRTVIAHFNLPNLPDRWWVEADGAADVYRKFKSGNRKDELAYALWEPYVSRALEIPGSHVLLDSSKLKGYIVDVLVAERKFTRDHPDLVRAVMEAYLRAVYAYRQNPGGFEALVIDDAKLTGSETLSREQAKKLVQGIEWKSTLENYSYFGLIPSRNGGGQHLEDIIANITDVLIKTGVLSPDSLAGMTHTLYYDHLLKEIKAGDFHPGKKISLIEGVGMKTGDLDPVRVAAQLRSLSEAEWESLSPVGRLRAKPISFARGRARINIQSKRDLKELAHKLTSWPQYYLSVIGHARPEGDPIANRNLAEERAIAAVDYLMEMGVVQSRIKAITGPPAGRGGLSQSVTFELGQLPY